MATYGVKFERSASLSLPRIPGGFAGDDDAFVDWCRNERTVQGRPLAIDLFSGAGGLSWGLEEAGWTVIGAVDSDEMALKTHEANMRGRGFNVDLGDERVVERLISLFARVEPDLVAGGPPCQPFSRAGRAKIRDLVRQGSRLAHDPRRDLWRTFVHIAIEVKPRAILMENVPDMAIGDDLDAVRELEDLLGDAGYSVGYRLLDAWRFGVPQHRKRLFIQARRDGSEVCWPTESGSEPTVRAAIFDLPRLRGSTGAREMPYSAPKVLGEFAQSARLGATPGIVHEHMTRPVRRDDSEAFALMTPETLYSDLPSHLRRYRDDSFTDKYKRLGWDDLSRTITAHIAKDGYWYIHPEELRTLTVREAARLQTFPDRFRFAGTRSNAFRQIGNAVPPRLAEAVARGLRADARGGTGSPPIEEIRSHLGAWAEIHRRDHWWLYPGEAWSHDAALVAVVLELNRVAPAVVRALVGPLARAVVVDAPFLESLYTAAWPESRSRRLREMHGLANREGDAWPVSLYEGLSRPMRAHHGMLLGQPVLAVTNHAAQVAAELLSLPAGQRGFRTDLKVAVARIVGTGDGAALRMAGLRAVPLEVAMSWLGTESMGE